MKFFCLPYAGGSSSIYSPWKNLFRNCTIIPIDLPGHGMNINMNLLGTFSKNLEFLYNKIISEISDSEKYCIFGHSLGGLFAYEICKKIEQSEFNNPDKIFISATKPPMYKKNYDLETDAKLKDILVEYNATPKEILNNEEIFNFFKPIILNDFKVYNDYELSDPDQQIKTKTIIFLRHKRLHSV
ncbi:thioesterase II family protein [Streptococcus lutetiensis]|uniref:thioesterase II family protein n=1 Tax=Streptococcus lutetiensis TaxID=150055 RepID=UPI002024E18E|nr:thioesterase domain-containing protein [Streptococcus lutetiensis]